MGPAPAYGAPARLSLWIADDTPDTLRAASIFIWTRRAANAASLVLVLPVRMLSPIWNCHCQISGSTVAATLYGMPLLTINRPPSKVGQGRYFASMFNPG